MKDLINVYILMSLLCCCTDIKAFNHTNQALWYDMENTECNLDQQSPIELTTSQTPLCFGMPSIYFYKFNVPHTAAAQLSNNGHTVDLQLPKTTNFTYISGGPLLNKKYISESLHFHWGSQNAHGSEHVIDGKRFSMEMHIVHRNAKYSNISEAVTHEDGLAVLAVFYDVKPSQQNDFVGLNKIVDALAAVQQFNSSTVINNVKLSDFFGSINTKNFFTYKGSLTTPPCSQAVTWIVFPQTIAISSNQMNQFRLLINEYGEILQNNYRHLQAKFLRRVCHRYTWL